LKQEEKIAKTYFKSIGFENIEFEPNGNRTPDFVIDESIAIEVRRLNKFYGGKPIEGVQYNLIPKIINQIGSFGKNDHKTSAFVGIKYSRPVKFNKAIKEKLNSILETHSFFMADEKEYILSNNLIIKIIPSLEKLNSQYQFGISTDLNQGGFVLSDVYNSLKFIIPEKTKLIGKFKTEYKIWWLALVDNIGNGLSENELIQLRKSIDFDLNFDKVFIISKSNPIKGGMI